MPRKALQNRCCSGERDEIASLNSFGVGIVSSNSGIMSSSLFWMMVAYFGSKAFADAIRPTSSIKLWKRVGIRNRKRKETSKRKRKETSNEKKRKETKKEKKRKREKKLTKRKREKKLKKRKREKKLKKRKEERTEERRREEIRLCTC
jgi:hypothetical protein